MTPTDSPERDAALASIARHGALGAAVIDLNATRVELADAIQSLVASVLATVAATQERDRLRRQVAAVRALLPDADHGVRCAVWGVVPVLGGGPGDCDCLLSRIATVLDNGSGPPGSHDRPHESVNDDTSRHPRDPEPHTVTESATAHPTRMENPQ